MLAAQLVNTGFPTINLFDKVSFALQLMDEYDVLHLPVLNEEKFTGMISKNDLLDGNEDALISTVHSSLQPISVKPEEHILTALKLISPRLTRAGATHHIHPLIAGQTTACQIN